MSQLKSAYFCVRTVRFTDCVCITLESARKRTLEKFYQSETFSPSIPNTFGTNASNSDIVPKQREE